MDKHIYGIEKRCTQETIIYTEIDDMTVEKKFYDKNGKLKKSMIQNVTDRKLINRKARDTQDFMLNMICNYGYNEIY